MDVDVQADTDFSVGERLAIVHAAKKALCIDHMDAIIGHNGQHVESLPYQPERVRNILATMAARGGKQSRVTKRGDGSQARASIS